ncbi:hypothetical protein [Methanobrevibacter sp.]
MRDKKMRPKTEGVMEQLRKEGKREFIKPLFNYYSLKEIAEFLHMSEREVLNILEK